jgi:hypothetical protein
MGKFRTTEFGSHVLLGKHAVNIFPAHSGVSEHVFLHFSFHMSERFEIKPLDLCAIFREQLSGARRAVGKYLAACFVRLL